MGKRTIRGPDSTSKWSELILLNAIQASRISINSFPTVRINNVCLQRRLFSPDPPKRLTAGELRHQTYKVEVIHCSIEQFHVKSAVKSTDKILQLEVETNKL